MHTRLHAVTHKDSPTKVRNINRLIGSVWNSANVASICRGCEEVRINIFLHDSHPYYGKQLLPRQQDQYKAWETGKKMKGEIKMSLAQTLNSQQTSPFPGGPAKSHQLFCSHRHTPSCLITNKPFITELLRM